MNIFQKVNLFYCVLVECHLGHRHLKFNEMTVWAQ